MSEWLKEHAWKACVRVTVPGVRIPLSPLSTPAGLAARKVLPAGDVARSFSINTRPIEVTAAAHRRFATHTRVYQRVPDVCRDQGAFPRVGAVVVIRNKALPYGRASDRAALACSDRRGPCGRAVTAESVPLCMCAPVGGVCQTAKPVRTALTRARRLAGPALLRMQRGPGPTRSDAART